MDETLPKLIGLALLVWLAVVVGAVVLAIALLLFLPASSGFPLYWVLFKRRYTLSNAKKGQCAGIVAAMFVIGLNITLSLHPGDFRYTPYWFIDWSFPPAVVGVWTGAILALGTVAVFLCLEAYRQTAWPYHRFVLNANTKSAGLRVRLLAVERTLSGLQQRIRLFETQHEGLLRERQELNRTVNDIVKKDAAFYAAELAVWRHQYAGLDRSALLVRWQAIQKELDALRPNDKQTVALTVERATLRLLVLEHDLRGPNDKSYDQLRSEDKELAASRNVLVETISQLRRVAENAQLAIRQIQRTSPSIQ